MDYTRNRKTSSICLAVSMALCALVQHIPIAQAATELCDKSCTCTSVLMDCNQDGLGRVLPWETTLWISNNNVSYNYETVIFTNNVIRNFSGQIPESPVKIFNLGYMSIRTIGKDVFTNLQDMEELYLNNNDLETLEPDVFRGKYLDTDYQPLRSLMKLHLDNNKLHSLNADLFEHITKLEVLTLSGNPLVTIDTPTLSALSEISFLEELDLSRTLLKNLPDSFLHTPKYLKVLNLSDNALEEIPQTLRFAQSLGTLYFDNNPLVNITGDDIFPEIKTLKKLYMRRMPELQYLGPHALGGVSFNLTELYINDNPLLTDIADMALARKDAATDVWPSLKKLYMQNCMLAHITRELFPKWRQLEDMDISNNPWTCECENQWIVEELIGDFHELHPVEAEKVLCAAPIEMKGQTIYSLAERRYEMRCLDLYGHQPEKDASYLVGTLVVLLIGIPLILSLIYAYQRRWFTCCDDGPAAFSRQFYSRTSGGDEF